MHFNRRHFFLYKIIACLLIFQFSFSECIFTYALSPASKFSGKHGLSPAEAKTQVGYYSSLSWRYSFIRFITTLLLMISMVSSDCLFKYKGYFGSYGWLHHYDPYHFMSNYGFDAGVAGSMTALYTIFFYSKNRRSLFYIIVAFLAGFVPMAIFEMLQFKMKPYINTLDPLFKKFFAGADYYDFAAYFVGCLFIAVPAYLETFYAKKALRIAEQIPVEKPSLETAGHRPDSASSA
jgi:hypothetical protein